MMSGIRTFGSTPSGAPIRDHLPSYLQTDMDLAFRGQPDFYFQDEISPGTDEVFMQSALRLAEKGLGAVAPNPPVGCVLVRDGQIISSGYHRRFGGAHAEVWAVESSPVELTGSTVYVTLEPCSITSKTPPCTDLLIKSGIRKVVIGVKDPNPNVNGNGIAQLRQAGIEVQTGMLEQQCSWLIRGFQKWINTGTPWVIAKIAQSSDGFIAPENARRFRITGTSAHQQVHQLRASVDGILVGSGTVKIDDPQLTTRLVEGPDPCRFIVDRKCELPQSLQVFRDGASPTVRLCGSSFAEEQRNSFGSIINVAEMDNKLDLQSALKQIGKIGITTLLVEGGAQLLGSFQEQNLIDEIHLYSAPIKLGNGALANPLVLDSSWDILGQRVLGQDILTIAQKKA